MAGCWEDFAKADQSWLIPFLDSVADRAAALAGGEAEKFMSSVSEDMREGTVMGFNCGSSVFPMSANRRSSTR